MEKEFSASTSSCAAPSRQHAPHFRLNNLFKGFSFLHAEPAEFNYKFYYKYLDSEIFIGLHEKLSGISRSRSAEPVPRYPRTRNRISHRFPPRQTLSAPLNCCRPERRPPPVCRSELPIRSDAPFPASEAKARPSHALHQANQEVSAHSWKSRNIHMP